MRKFRLCLNQRAFSAAQALMGGGMLIAVALGLSQVISNSLKSQRQSSLRSARDQLITYYTGLTRNPVAKANTLAAADAQNQVLKKHTDATAPQAAGAWETPPAGAPLNVHPINLYDAKNELAVPADGLYLMEIGQLCPDAGLPAKSCPADKATWKVEVQWIALSGTEYEYRAVINQVRKAEGDISLKEYSFKSVDTGGDFNWQRGAANSIYKQSGFVGVGTDTPRQTMHVNGNTRFSSPDDPERFFMEISPVQRIAGDVYYDFVVKDTGGLQEVPVMTIRGHDGFVGVGTLNPVANLHVSGEGGSTDLQVTNTDSNKTMHFLVENDGDIFFKEQSTFANSILLSKNGNVGIGLASGAADPTVKLLVNGDISAVAVTETSDGRLKEDVRALSDSLARVLRLRGVSYVWTAEAKRARDLPDAREIGLIAQEVEKVFPEAVRTDSEGMKSVNYTRLVAPLIEALREQQAEIAREKAARLKLEARVRELESSAKKIQ